MARPVEPDGTILEIGCGGGMTIARLAAVVRAVKVYGVDYSPTSVATSRETNREATDALKSQHFPAGSVSVCIS